MTLRNLVRSNALEQSARSQSSADFTIITFGFEFSVRTIAGDRAVLDPLDGFVDNEKRHQKPLTRDDRLPKVVLHFDVATGRAEDAVNQVLKPGAVDVVQLIGGRLCTRVCWS